jgi:thioredoxin 1
MSLILFSTPWFAPCRLQEPILRRLASRFEGKATMGEVHVDEYPEVAWKLGIQGVPTVIIFKKGKELQRFVGLQPEDMLSNALKTFLK